MHKKLSVLLMASSLFVTGCGASVTVSKSQPKTTPSSSSSTSSTKNTPQSNSISISAKGATHIYGPWTIQGRKTLGTIQSFPIPEPFIMLGNHTLVGSLSTGLGVFHITSSPQLVSQIKSSYVPTLAAFPGSSSFLLLRKSQSSSVLQVKSGRYGSGQVSLGRTVSFGLPTHPYDAINYLKGSASGAMVATLANYNAYFISNYMNHNALLGVHFGKQSVGTFAHVLLPYRILHVSSVPLGSGGDVAVVYQNGAKRLVSVYNNKLQSLASSTLSPHGDAVLTTYQGQAALLTTGASHVSLATVGQGALQKKWQLSLPSVQYGGRTAYYHLLGQAHGPALAYAAGTRVVVLHRSGKTGSTLWYNGIVLSGDLSIEGSTISGADSQGLWQKETSGKVIWQLPHSVSTRVTAASPATSSAWPTLWLGSFQYDYHHGKYLVRPSGLTGIFPPPGPYQTSTYVPSLQKSIQPGYVLKRITSQGKRFSLKAYLFSGSSKVQTIKGPQGSAYSVAPMGPHGPRLIGSTGAKSVTLYQIGHSLSSTQSFSLQHNAFAVASLAYGSRHDIITFWRGGISSSGKVSAPYNITLRTWHGTGLGVGHRQSIAISKYPTQIQPVSLTSTIAGLLLTIGHHIELLTIGAGGHIHLHALPYRFSSVPRYVQTGLGSLLTLTKQHERLWQFYRPS